MNNPIIIANDAMGGDNSPNKVIEGISLHCKNSADVTYKIFGKKTLLEPLINKYNLPVNRFDLIHTDNTVEGEDSALSAVKKRKDNLKLIKALEAI